MEDQSILEGIRHGDQACLQALLKKYGRYAAAVAAKVGQGHLTEQDVEELTSDVFLQIWKAADNIRLEGNGLKSYIGMTARNLTLNVLRKKNLHLLELAEGEAASSPSAEDLYLRQENREALHKVIAELNEVDRTIFIKRYFYLERVMDIARQLHMTDKAVSARIARTKQLIADTCRKKGVL